jgi:tetratricopeptide (TPR) repeat protein
MKFLAALFIVPYLLFGQSVEEGNSELQRGHIGRAKEIFEAVLKGDDKNAEAHYRLGLIELRRDYRNEDDAVDQMERATELAPQNADYQYGYGAALGMKAQNSGILKQAFLAPKVKKAFLRAVELNPNLVQARIGLAQYYVRAPSIMGGNEEKGWQEIDTAITLDEYQGRVAKAGLLTSEKKFDQAEQELKSLSSKYPRDWRVWNSLSGFYIRQKRNAEGINAAQKFVQIRPDTAESYKSLGQAQLQDGEYDSAIDNLKKALQLDKDHITATYLLAKTYDAKGMKREARESYQRVLDLNPWDSLRKEVEKNLKDLSS